MKVLDNITMRRGIYVVVFTAIGLLISTAVTAQNNGINKKDALAYRLGFNINMPFVTAHTDTFKSRVGWGLWGEAEYKLSNRWRVMPGLAYNSFGFNQYFYNDSGAVERRVITEHYMELGSRFSYQPLEDENSVRIILGAAFSFLVDRKTSFPDIEGTNVTRLTLDNKKSMQPGILLSAGFMAPLSKRIDLGIQYNQGLPAKIHPLDVVGRVGSLQVKLNYKIVPRRAETVLQPEVQADMATDLPYKYDSLMLIVRVKENFTRIALLKDQGYLEEAEDERLKALEAAMEIRNAFTEKLTFIPVYFIYDSDSKLALNGKFDGILLNSAMQRDSSIKLPAKQHLFAEFARQFDEVSNTSGMYGLVVYTDKFKNIPEPFPAFVSNAYGFLNEAEVVAKFEKRLKKYFAPKQ
ncbi:MAG: PorT family protein [Bacteroidetes bacterium]|nr:MAG: PorT family protein [Bacteroidota bacterium]